MRGLIIDRGETVAVAGGRKRTPSVTGSRFGEAGMKEKARKYEDVGGEIHGAEVPDP